MSGKTLQIHLDDAMRIRAESSHFNFIGRIRAAVEGKGWQVQILPETTEAPAPGHFALHHMTGPLHRRSKIFRRCYYYPYWNIESVPQRWRWPVAQAKFRPDQIDGPEARRFIHQLRQRIMPGLTPTAPQHVLIPLQGQLTEARSFQTMSPVEMVEAVAHTGKRCIATLHPNETYSPDERAALNTLALHFPNLTIGGNSRELLAGRPAGPQPTRGPILCVCHGVGTNEVRAAAGAEGASIEAIGTATRAGTNCGPCRPLIARLLAEATEPMKEAAA